MVAVPIFSIFYKSKPCLYIKNQRKQVEKCHKRGEALEDIGHGLRLQRVHCKYGGGEKWDEGPGTRDRGRGTRNQRPTIRVWKAVTSPWFPVPEVRSSEGQQDKKINQDGVCNVDGNVYDMIAGHR